jgi:activating signal cointegrator complex subunit 3
VCAWEVLRLTASNPLGLQAIRVVQAMVDVSADAGWLTTSLNCMSLIQMIVQAQWHDASTLTTLPNVDEDKVGILKRFGVECLPELVGLISSHCEGHGTVSESLAKSGRQHTQMDKLIHALTGKGMTNAEIAKAFRVCASLPVINVWWSMETDAFGPEDEAMVSVTLERLNRSAQVIAPKFPKPKSEGHWLVLGCEAQGELLAVKRVTVRNGTTQASLIFYTDDLDPGDGNVTLSLYLISDSYLGLDQQYDIPIRVDAAGDEGCDGTNFDGKEEDYGGDGGELFAGGEGEQLGRDFVSDNFAGHESSL